jgi:hypothetical protein
MYHDTSMMGRHLHSPGMQPVCESQLALHYATHVKHVNKLLRDFSFFTRGERARQCSECGEGDALMIFIYIATSVTFFGREWPICWRPPGTTRSQTNYIVGARNANAAKRPVHLAEVTR